jgi:hypothetical protein
VPGAVCDLTDFPEEFQMQRVIRHTGLFAACACGRQPKHISERWDRAHWMECPPCGVRTAKFGTAQEAVAAWEAQESLQSMRAA